MQVPEHLSYEEAATLPCAALTGYSTLTGTKSLKGGDTVLVQGTRGVSIFALQLAVASGALVIVISSSDKKLEVARKLGAHHIINYRTVPDWDAEVLKLVGAKLERVRKERPGTDRDGSRPMAGIPLTMSLRSADRTLCSSRSIASATAGLCTSSALSLEYVSCTRG